MTGSSGRNLQKDAYAKLHSIDPDTALNMAKENNIKTNRSLDLNSHSGLNSIGKSGSNIKLAV